MHQTTPRRPSPSVLSPLRGAIGLLALVLNTLFWCIPLFVLALVKLALPFEPVRRLLDHWLNALASGWVAGNGAWIRLALGTQWQVSGTDGLRYRGWYLVNCNHQTWVDIFVLQHVLHRRIPLLKFFLKQELIYVPVIGLAWWALDFPFMRRHSRAALRRNPELRNQDRETARRACAKFLRVPTSVMNFAEGTRFTPAKHADQASPYRHLLNPKAGAMAMALGAMGPRFEALVDATIVYPDGVPSFWDFLCGRVPRIVVQVRELPIPQDFFTSDYETDKPFRTRFHRWLAALWEEKDAQIEAVLSSRG
ncbi:acyltransferase [Xylophilus sp.]|uniref:acyltransferase n=1 Tax=Xylophilus sp. TaxID=2653893 RepID=UPI0013BD0BDE|nr:acyltransferase [Xylophilus sp.]KAF1043727.1 MAG: putative acyltransferase YihG [Xylophilus sp.]